MTTDNNPARSGLIAMLAVIAFAIILLGLGYLGVRLHGIEQRLDSLTIGSSVEQPTTTPQPKPATGHTVYVPAYSHVYSDGGKPYLLEVTLSVRNTDSQSNLTLTRADYYDTQGKRLRRHLKAARQLMPLESESFIVEKTDYKGGSGSNFIVEWSAERPISKPVIEAVMIGTDPDYQISFLRSGVPVERFEP